MRVIFHPILGEMAERREVTIYFENRVIKALEKECIAAPLIANNIKAFTKTEKRGEIRGYFYGIGCCSDCVMMVDGNPNVRTCVTAVRDGMRIEKQIGLGSWEKGKCCQQK